MHLKSDLIMNMKGSHISIQINRVFDKSEVTKDHCYHKGAVISF